LKHAAQGNDDRDGEQLGKSKPVIGKDSDTKALEGDLSAALGMRVSVDHKMGTEAGSITISYKTLDQLDDLCALLSATNLDGPK
jgi:ParB family chromosome partitioning protein